MKKALIMTSIAFVLLLAVVAAGLNVIFTITYIEARFSTFSLQGEAEAVELKEELDAFVGKSMTFLDLDDITETVEQFPSFSMESVKKKFPKTVEIVIRERRELFAYQTAEGQYAMIDSEGMCTRLSKENCSRTGGENILLTNFTLTAQVGSRVEGEYFEALLSTFSGFETHMADAKSNITEVVLSYNGSDSSLNFNSFEIRMQEGSVITMYDPLSRAKEKAEKIIQVYFSLDDIQKMYNRLIVVENPESGEIYTDSGLH